LYDREYKQKIKIIVAAYHSSQWHTPNVYNHGYNHNNF
jgi:hypothetical protein